MKALLRYKKALRFWPYIYLFTFWFAFSSPYFIQGLVPYPSKYQATFFPPWSHHEKWWGPVKNNAMPDVIDQIYPWKHFTIESIKQTGEIPFWNPNNFAGNPHVANFQTAAFTPLNILFFLFPFVDAWSLLILLQPLLAGLFTYVYLKELKVSSISALISSVTFMFCGFAVVWMAYGTLSYAALFLPLILFGFEKAYNTKNKKYLSLIPLGLALSFFSGHFQTSLYVALFTAAYLLFTVITHRKVRIHFLTTLAFITGIGISLLQILPTITFYQNSIRSGLVYSGGGIPWYYLITLIAPDFFGNPVTRNDWLGSYAEWASFTGIIPLVLAIIALFAFKNRYVKFFLAAAVITLLFATDSPAHDLLVMSGLPIFSTSIPSRLIVLFSFSVAVLSGIGFDTLHELVRKQQKKKLLIVGAGLSLCLLSIWVTLMIVPILPAEYLKVAQKNLVLPTGLFFLMTGRIVYSLLRREKYMIVFTSILLLTLASLDSYRFASKWMPFDQKDLVFADVPVLEAMQKEIGFGRYYGNLGTEVATYYNLPSIEGYDPLYVQRYGEFIRYSYDGTFRDAERSVVRLDRRGKYTDRVIDILGTTVIFHPRADSHQSWAYPVWENGERFKRFYEDDKFELYRNTSALPRAMLFTQFEVISDGKALLKRFYSDDFDFRNILLVENSPLSVKKTDSPVRNSVEIVDYLPNKVTIKTRTDIPALLFLSDTYYPHWFARVNGNSVEILRANYAFRAVEVPVGEATVEFYYKEY